MRPICLQQLGDWNCNFFRSITFINLEKCFRSFSTSRLSSRPLQTRMSPIYQNQQWNTISNIGVYDLTRIKYNFFDSSLSNHKLHLRHSRRPPCRSSYNDLRSHYFKSSIIWTRSSMLLPITFSQMGLNHTLAAKDHQLNRQIHTSPRANILIPPHVWLLLKPAQKLFAIIIGRSIRKWWQALPPNKQDLFKENVKRNKWKLLASLSGLAIVFALFYFTHLEENPITGRSRLSVFTKEHYDFLTKLEYEGLMEEFNDQILPERDPRHLVVHSIVDHLVKCNRDLPAVEETDWIVHVVDKPDINAFVLPNGQVFVYTGLLEAVTDTDQLSFMLGHEIAHVLLEHTADMASVSHFLDFLFLISLTIIWALCPLDSLAVLGQWIQSKLKQACVDVRASPVFMQVMDLPATLEGQPRVPEWLSTHPSHENRAEHLNRLLPEALKLRESCNCPPLGGPDPRLVFQLGMKQLIKSREESKITEEPWKSRGISLPIPGEEIRPVLTVVTTLGK
ncbi:metalloendopeptidase OMA1, mitochondrial isoform X1 [Ambystoma mexicanum]|uniref:metalloendopeptidase OMA1, mitochondrial isoform X1 n=1 Tax=Ambystoma mexicanum TaxID=8296 RepID=UPI0037E78A51